MRREKIKAGLKNDLTARHQTTPSPVGREDASGRRAGKSVSSVVCPSDFREHDAYELSISAIASRRAFMARRFAARSLRPVDEKLNLRATRRPEGRTQVACHAS